MKFARLVGIKYSTFAHWVKQRQERRAAMKLTVCEASQASSPTAKVGPVRLFEALVEGTPCEPAAATTADGLLIELPGGSRLRPHGARRFHRLRVNEGRGGRSICR
jgi:hypothetical protein